MSDIEGPSVSGRDTRGIEVLNLPTRAYNVLTTDGGFSTVQDLLDATEYELLRLPNFGHKSLWDVRAAIMAVPPESNDILHKLANLAPGRELAEEAITEIRSLRALLAEARGQIRSQMRVNQSLRDDLRRKSA